MIRDQSTCSTATRCSPPKVPEQVKIERRGSRLNLSHPRAGARAPNTRCPTKRTWRHRHVLNPPGTTGNHGYRRAARPTCDLPICRAFPSLPGMSARPWKSWCPRFEPGSRHHGSACTWAGCGGCRQLWERLLGRSFEQCRALVKRRDRLDGLVH